MGWASLGNGELLRRAAVAGFEALVTMDRSLEYQQNVGRSGLGVIVLVARSNRLADLAPLSPHMLTALGTLQAGQVVHIHS